MRGWTVAMARALTLGVCVWAGQASAATWIEEYAYDFDAVQASSFSGTDGWVSGYTLDPWTNVWYGGEVTPTTDVGGGSWTPSSPTTNHLIQTGEGPWADVSVRVDVALLDDDTVGLVARKSGASTFYLFLMTLDARPAPGAGGDPVYPSPGAYLYRVDNGVATVVASGSGAGYEYRWDDGYSWAYQRLRLDVVGDTVTASYSADPSGAWTNADVLLSYTDPQPLPAGTTGLYAYEMGESYGYVGFARYRLQLADSDDDGWVNDEDCGPYDAAISPDAAEVCGDQLDNDCDGAVDEGFDADGDGYDGCGADCDDGDPAVYPGATERCNGIDDDCDGDVDEGQDADGDGVDLCAGDCDDGDASVYPGATEWCNGADDDCDGAVDEDDAADAATWYADADGDGHGDAGSVTLACDPPAGYVADATDCDDGVATTHPGADERCNGADDDCDGAVDEDDAVDAATWFADGDGDGFGDATASTVACDAPPGHVAQAGDCDDDEATVYPGRAESCDGLDNDCDGALPADEADADGDGQWICGAAPDGGDCDDADPLTWDGAPEQCDGADNDCDGVVDEGVDDDLDGDGVNACQGDCDNEDPAVYPGAAEICDGKDSDCDGALPADEADADGDDWSICMGDCDDDDDERTPEDADGDGFSTCDDDCDDDDDGLTPEDADGDGFSTCDDDCDDEDPARTPADGDGDGYSSCDGDCDDGDIGAYPGNLEACADGADNDCDGFVDADDPDCGGGDDDDTGDDDDDTGDDDDTTAPDDDDDTSGDDDDLRVSGCECASGARGGAGVSPGTAALAAALLGVLVIRRRRG